MNASFEISPHKLAQNWQPKASSRQLEALKGLLTTGAKTGVAKLAQNWPGKKRSWPYSVHSPHDRCLVSVRGSSLAPRLLLRRAAFSDISENAQQIWTNFYGEAASDAGRLCKRGVPVPTGPPGDSVRPQPLPIISVVTVLSGSLAT
jgi:hypothetical protein